MLARGKAARYLVKRFIDSVNKRERNQLDIRVNERRTLRSVVLRVTRSYRCQWRWVNFSNRMNKDYYAFSKHYLQTALSTSNTSLPSNLSILSLKDNPRLRLVAPEFREMEDADKGKWSDACFSFLQCYRKIVEWLNYTLKNILKNISLIKTMNYWWFDYSSTLSSIDQRLTRKSVSNVPNVRIGFSVTLVCVLAQRVRLSFIRKHVPWGSPIQISWNGCGVLNDSLPILAVHIAEKPEARCS